MTIHLIRDMHDRFVGLLTEDPVRPSIPAEQRIGTNREIFVLVDDIDRPKAITCVSYQNAVPTHENGLFESFNQPDIAVFYTIWSYQSGSGRELIIAARNWIQENRPEIRRFVTLSPQSDMARIFHLRNGAQVYRINPETVNYEYL